MDAYGRALETIYEEYTRLAALEDSLLLELAVQAAQEGFLEENKRDAWFTSMNAKAAQT